MKIILYCFIFAFSFVSLQAQMYVRGDFNGWGTADVLVDDATDGDAVASDGIFTCTVTIATAGRYEWKVANSGWSTFYPNYGGSDNSWLYTTADNQEVVFTFDTNTYEDGFLPQTNIINADDQLPTPSGSISAPGDHNWDNNSSVMYDDGANGDVTADDGIYTFKVTHATAGTYNWKPVLSGTWDAWVPQGRSINAANVSYTTTSDNEDVYLYLDLNTGRTTSAVGEPLPVELTTFSANVSGKTVMLNWQTATEINNYGFDIERRVEKSEDWQKIAFVKGNGSTNKYSNYSFSDIPDVPGVYFYRLKQIDNDGTFEVSGYVSATVGAPQRFGIEQNYPNPFNPSTSITFSLPEQADISLSVYDITGRFIREIATGDKDAGSHVVDFNASDLASGTYIYKLQATGISGEVFSGSGKMLLLK